MPTADEWRKSIQDVRLELYKLETLLNRATAALPAGAARLEDPTFDVDLKFFELTKARASKLYDNVAALKKRLKIMDTGASTGALLGQAVIEVRRDALVEGLRTNDRDSIVALASTIETAQTEAAAVSNDLAGHY